MSPKLYILIIRYPALSVDISKLIKYYTDRHDVDEDMTAIVNYGGGRTHGTNGGVTCRSADNPPDLLDFVASSDISKLIIYYTDIHDVDEDLRTIMHQGKRWDSGSMGGITRRDMYYSSSVAHLEVASKKINR